ATATRTATATSTVAGVSTATATNTVPTPTRTRTATATSTPIAGGATILQSVFRADDGTAYQVIQVDPSSGTNHVRITSIGGSAAGIGGCNASESMSGGVAQAVAGGLVGVQPLHPYNQIVRTFVLD